MWAEPNYSTSSIVGIRNAFLSLSKFSQAKYHLPLHQQVQKGANTSKKEAENPQSSLAPSVLSSSSLKVTPSQRWAVAATWLFGAWIDAGSGSSHYQCGMLGYPHEVNAATSLLLRERMTEQIRVMLLGTGHVQQRSWDSTTKQQKMPFYLKILPCGFVRTEWCSQNRTNQTRFQPSVRSEAFWMCGVMSRTGKQV